MWIGEESCVEGFIMLLGSIWPEIPLISSDFLKKRKVGGKI